MPFDGPMVRSNASRSWTFCVLKGGFTVSSILGPPTRRMKDLLKFYRDQLRWVVRLFTGHCHLKGHLFKLGLTDDPHLQMVPRKRWISNTHPMWLWGYSLFKMPSLGPVFYRTKWLL
jgi:hypothetical protein